MFLGETERKSLAIEAVNSFKKPGGNYLIHFSCGMDGIHSQESSSPIESGRKQSQFEGISRQSIVTILSLESKLSGSIWAVRQSAVKALGLVYPALIEKGKEVSLSALESKLSDSNWAVRQSAVKALGLVYPALIEKGKILDEDYYKYGLWVESNLPYQETLIKQYIAADDPRRFILGLRTRAENAVNNGFDYNKEEDLWLAYLGLRVKGINNINYEDEFKPRIRKMGEFDGKYPGYWKGLFSKAGNPKIIDLSRKETRLDASNVDQQVFSRNLDRIIKARQRIDSLAWMEEDFKESKVFNPRDIYYYLKRRQAQEKGMIKEGERFRCEFPPKEMMARDLLSDKKALYKTVFLLAKDRMGDKLIGQRCLLLMRDLIISDIMLDDGLLRQMQSSDLEERIAAFKNFYEDYKNHLPNSLGLETDRIKGLRKLFEDFSSEVYTEISKVKVVAQAGRDIYRLVETRGFLGAFRGRAGIVDCSFDMDDKGDAYARAMHEDALYLFVYKGKQLKGYVGLMLGQTTDKKKILAVDTINSPSLDGEDLLLNLFGVLDAWARELGCVGIALPKDLGPSFNFDNEDTILKMAVYKKATPISVAPLHKESWGYFTRMFGEDQYNSIEKGEFMLVNLNGYGTAAHLSPPLSGLTSSLATTDNKGGIDLHALPIQTESVASSALGFLPGARAFKGNLDTEWVQIQSVFNAGIRPSIQRLSEYTAAASASPLSEDKIDQVRVMLADILRRDEESQNLTPAEESCKQLLMALEAG